MNLRGDKLVAMLIMGLRVATLAAKFGLALFIARFMDLETLGLYGLIAGATTVGPTLMSLGLLNTLSRTAVGHTPLKVAVTFRNYWALVLALYAVAAGALAMAGWWVVLPAFTLVVVAITLMEHINQDVFTLLTNRAEPLMANVLTFVRSAVWMFVFMGLAVAVPGFRTLEALLLCWVLGVAAPLLMFAWHTRAWPWLEAVRAPWDLKWYVTHVRQAGVMYVSDLTNAGGQYVDRYLVSALLGLEMTGVYVLFWQIANAVYNLANTSTMQVYRPRLIAAFQARDTVRYWQLFATCTRQTLAIYGGLAVMAGVVIPFFIAYLRQPLAHGYLPVLWLALLGMGARITFDMVGYGLYTRHRDVALASTYAGALVLAVPLNIMLLQALGIYGAPAALLVNMLAGILIRWRLLA